MTSMPHVRKKALFAVTGAFLVLGVMALFLAIGTSADAATPPGKTEFRKQANAVCQTYTRSITQLSKTLGPTLKPTAASMKAWARLTRTQTRSLAALVPPPTFVVRVEKMLTASRSLVPLGLAAYQAEQDGDTVRGEALYLKATHHADAFTRLADGMGLFICGNE
jgi:hypothetical protein